MNDSVVEKLISIGCLKFGNFTLKSGQTSPIYCDLRLLISYPEILTQVTDDLWTIFSKMEIKLDRICGVPYTALPIATHLSIQHSIPMVFRRKEAKEYGTKKMVEGKFEDNDKCLIVEDVVTTGSSVLETAENLRSVGLKVDTAIVLVDREQGALENLKQAGVKLISLITMSDIVEYASKTGCLPSEQLVALQNLNNGHMNGSSNDLQSLKDRAALTSNWSSKNLMSVLMSKQSNLCLSVDETDCQSVINLVDKIGPFVCAVKTHIDIIRDLDKFGTEKFLGELTSLSLKHDFLLIEDRKFSDIGNTFQMQLFGGPFRIASWAHLVTAHSLSGPGMLAALKSSKCDTGSAPGIIFVAEMSSSGNLVSDYYTRKTVELAKQHKDLVCGFVYRNFEAVKDDSFVRFMPGVALETSSDGDQNYVTVERAMADEKCDVIIVGRAILNSREQIKTAQEFKDRAWQIYSRRYADLNA